MSFQSRRPMTHTCKGPHQPASLIPRVAYCLSLEWNNNPKGHSREEKTNMAQPWQCCVNFRRSFSSLIPHLVLSYSEECPQQGLLGEWEASSMILTVWSSPIHLTSARAFKDFSSMPLHWHFSHCWPKDHCITLPFFQFIISTPPAFGSSFQKWKQS